MLMVRRAFRRGALWVLCACMGWTAVEAAPADDPPGPYDVRVLAGGVALSKKLAAETPLLAANADWSVSGWVRPARAVTGPALIAGIGDPQGAGRYFVIDGGRLGFAQGADNVLRTTQTLRAGAWTQVAAVAQGARLTLYANGRKVASGRVQQTAVAPMLVFGPRQQPPAYTHHFGGDIAGFAAQAGALDADAIARLAAAAPDPALQRFEDASPGWRVQVKQMAGQLAPQPAATLPRSTAAFATPVARPVADAPALQPLDATSWRVGAWQLAAAPELGQVTGAALSRSDYAGGTATWRVATVPGTVLTTLVDRGVYPDPDIGLNNMAIPEALSRQDWWYRSSFDVPAAAQGKRLELLFNGINYAGEIWVNGVEVGRTRGAFARGRFDVSKQLKPGRNAIAVRVSPPPHPGIAHEQSMTAGVGENGGMQALDGPTFIASEGWDWIPAVRDRNAGLWQDVQLHASGPLALGDTQVLTARLAPDHQRAELEINVPLRNATAAAVQGTVQLAFGDVRIQRQVTVPAGGSTLKFTAADTPQLRIANPRLWWPNGYGEPALYTLQVGVDVAGARSDAQQVRFGIREVTYELSLFDDDGALRRVLVDLNQARQRGERIVDVRHAAIRPVPGGNAQSLYPGALGSPAVQQLDDSTLAPHLVIRINGVRIAAKGGNWGMDDWRKRVSRERLEPYFRLQRDAHFNVVRNWVGQNTEASFFELADEYGMLVLNDFWQSTQNYNMEPADAALFLDNAAEVIKRFRNHPSIVLWFGRNEGVPAPILNEGLDKLVAELDGTRWYTGSSNEINLQGSGPYNYREPVAYFNKLAQGFSVEVGTPSFSTLESFKASVPAVGDQWPISDAWAYHDWHQSGNGDTNSFMRTLTDKLGAPTGLADFERKAQLLNYETHRAIFEGFNAQLWSKNSGRLLWMSHPAWPSSMWQVYSHDYDTHAAYYGVRNAAETLHVQMNLPGYEVVVVNNAATPVRGLRVRAEVYASDGKLLQQREQALDAAAVAVSAPVLQLAPSLKDTNGLGFVRLQLLDRDAVVRSRNFYWVARDAVAMRGLDALAKVPLQLTTQLQQGNEAVLRATVRNPSQQVALNTKLTLVDAQGQRILPAYYSDNYLSPAPGEERVVEVRGPSAATLRNATLQLRGWNAEPSTGVANGSP
ncbi:glycosyl hydrolase [Xanthomonas citri pv. fuscans]|uniref:Glycosyl hydrolase n=2 Tax=Xanthomonas citri TaxID=346 RepID=A0AB34QAL8_XANCI|nr:MULTISPECIES: glycoside hydrolase family 2 [Xanthomonas]ATS64290.1 glycoside hydrolase family 2 [Xanthomonas citri pv. phaseoli var. fuscans]ATS70645.1 glycoside hydrolase family 2 [Xanthomonas citri pv. phaseoli var. fuscans]ATS79602.1 glycoside hydrolase family 2 [Xanthomonas citri pv. phaseoli var. fuscans]ATS87165.1 glycoside hydrolase family 2 [Xanthomonas citri pv. phaseoli var. fuscans]AZU18662.1 glycosyl hydrolase [Xanthomonas citri pv. fuscans]